MGKASRKKKEMAIIGGGVPNAAPVTAVPGSASWSRPLAVVVAAAAIFRVAYYLQYRSGSVFFETPVLDAWIYDSWARRIAGGEWRPAEPFYFAPGYPYALAIFYKLIASTSQAVYVLQMGLGLLNILMIHRLTGRAFGRREADVAAALTALYASFPFLETKLMSSTLALSLLLASLLALLSAGRKGGPLRWAGAGVLLGLSSLVRPETMLASPILLLWIWRWGIPRESERRARATALACAALLAGWGAAITPAALHNFAAGGGSTLISSQGGITFYQSNNERARGLYVFLSKEGFSGAPERQAVEEKEIAEKALGRTLTRSEVSSYWFGKGLEFIASQPARFVWLLGMKFLRFIGSYEYSTEYILYVERETVWLLWIPFVPFALIVALAAPAILRSLLTGRTGGRPTSARPPNESAILLLLIVLANLGAVLLFYVSSRYRLPSAPPLMAFAACTVVRLGDAWRSRRREEGYILAAVVAVIFLVAHFQKDQSATIQEANVHYNEGNLWSGKGNHEMAIREFRRALAMDDSRYETWFNLGNSLRAIGRPAEAADAYESSATRRPRFFNAHLRRAQELEEAGDWAGASAAYRKAEELRADDFEVQLGMGRAEARLGDHAEAIRHLDRALQLRPGDPAAAAERARL